MVTLNVLGLNCGTSIDGIDVAHCRISSIKSSNDINVELLGYTEIPVDPELRRQVLRLCRPNQDDAATNMAEVCDLNFALGREFARAIEESGFNLSQVDIIASHGQTLWHQPVGENRSTLQMGEPAVIAHKTGRTVVSNFRVAELAAGRQGAPLAGFFEAALLSDDKKTITSQNIGGIGNATVLIAPESAATTRPKGTYQAFDTGPGNVFIDAAIRIITNGSEHFDRDGVRGARGAPDIDDDIVNEYLDSEPYFGLKPPKTTGRELFSDDVARDLVTKMEAKGKSTDAIIATITRITAESIARAYEAFVLPQMRDGAVIDEIYICGGGAFNPNILEHLRSRFPKTKVLQLSEAPIKVDPGAKEAVLFAVLGFLGVCGRSVPVASDSETTAPTIMGVVTPGENYREIMKAVTQDSEFTTRGPLSRVLM